MQNPLNVAIELAKEVGQVQLEALGKDHQVDFKGVIDIVTDVDKRSEAIIVDRIQKDFPDHDILAEEGTGNRKEGSYRWIVDPLDGTVNFNHAYPHFGPSIALEYRGDLIFGVVYEPNRDELFIAEKGSGAELNGKKIEVSQVANLNHSLLATGFPYNIREGDDPTNIDHFSNFLMKAQALRRDGMAAGQFCDLACGRFDGIWQFLLKPWDIAAGTIIVKEAGGKVTNIDGSDIDIYGEGFVASNVFLHDAMLDVLKR